MKPTLIFSLSTLRSISMFPPLSEKNCKIFNFYLSSVSLLSSHLLDCYFLDFWFPVIKDNSLHSFLRWRYNLLYFNLFSKWQLHEYLFLQTIFSRIPIRKFNVWPSLLNPLFLKIYIYFISTFKCYKWV